jgi:hypothetical protein
MTETYIGQSKKKALSKREWKRYLASLRASYKHIASIQAHAEQAQKKDATDADLLLDTSRDTLSS